MTRRRRLRVLESFPAGNDQTNPYLLQLVRALREHEPAVDVTLFSWRAALLGRYDVLHVHWPERLVRGSSPIRTRTKQVRFVALLIRLRLRRTPVVRTLHNLRSHESGSALERRLLGGLDRLTTVAIRLNPATPVPARVAVHLIPHGHYRDWMPPTDSTRVPGRLLFFGLIRPYKGIEELVAAVEGTTREGVSLLVAGPPSDSELTRRLEKIARPDGRVAVEAAYLPDAELSRRIAEASLIVLPYRAVHNSGAALLALSLNRPVLMPRAETTELLQQEVGPAWVLLYDGALTPARLEAALASAERVDGAPELRSRDWASGAEAHITAYRDALDRRRTRPRT